MYLKENDARARGGDTTDFTADIAAQLILMIGNAALALKDRYDIFLSHSMRDAGLVLGVKKILEASGKTVYVDWIEDPELDRNAISVGTAETLRKQMRKSDSCFYLHSRHSRTSLWMPWELGFFDGMNGNVAILPLIPPNGHLDFSGQEYLELYPKVDFTDISSSPNIYINKSAKTETAAVFKRYDDWKTGNDKLRPSG
ncbi:toll/interleukin-1 receptor domain-containing protein [Brevundimonas sp. GCM10030266]|uniref:toll/interleukin-1 receptor domain-containing protein n=1 Tax=Brevundimonas sp. GCM10030266 TaxID=3273386 RepID=UPI003619E53F